MTESKNCTTNFYPELCGVNVVVDPQARLGTDDDRVIIIGQSTGTVTSGAAQVNDATRAGLYGADSMLNRMISEFRQSCPTAELWAYALPNTGTAGDADVTFAGVAAAATSGIVYLWVNGVRYAETFDPTVDTDAILASRFAAAITLNQSELTAVAAASVLSITTIGKGEIGGFLDVRSSYSVRPDLTSSPAVTVTIVNTAPTGLASLAGVAALGQGFEFVVNPYTDDAAIADVSTYLCGQWTGGSNSRAYGVFYGTPTQAITFGQGANNALLSYMAIDGALTPPYLESSSFGCLAYGRLNCQSNEVSQSMTGMVMPALLAPEFGDRYTAAQQAALIEAGVGYFTVNRVNDVAVGRSVTTYTTADNGTIDLSLADTNKPAQIACISRFMRENLTAKYTGYSFRSDGVVGTNNSKVATIGAIENYVISLAQRLSDRNLIQDVDGFIESLSVSVNPDNGCIQVIVDPQLVNQFCCMTVTLRTF